MSTPESQSSGAGQAPPLLVPALAPSPPRPPFWPVAHVALVLLIGYAYLLRQRSIAQERLTFSPAEADVTALAFAPDGLLAGCADGRVLLCSPADGQVLATLAAAAGNMVKLWNVPLGLVPLD